MKEFDIFTGVGDYDQIDTLLSAKQSRFSEKTYLIGNEERVITGSSYHAYIKFSEGCNQTCSFCAIPSFKGKLNSRDLDMVAQEVESLVRQGYYDFSFISQDSSSYLRDKNVKDGLIHLIKRIELIEGVRSARLLYLYPTTASQKLLGEIANSPVFHNYFDMPIQHISDKMLKMMKRGFGKAKTIEQLEYMKSLPNAFLRTSFIVGHPGETQEDFDEMCEFARTFGFDRISTFAYSDEEETAAYDMEGKLSQEVIDERAETMGAIAEEVMDKSLEKKVGKEVELVIDGESDEHEYLLSARELGWTPEIDGEIYVNDNELGDDVTLEFGKVYTARITEKVGDKLLATVIR
jgi:ribosomal protein S12 methylthiotransferase